MTGSNRTSDEDVYWMRRALALARRGEALASPNPMVGAVIVKDGRCVAEGWHKRCGGMHAEIAALRRAGSSAAGAVMYLTLEPCVHQGRTPPCAPVLIRSGLSRVVVAVRDPNPLVDGRGVRMLREAGIDVRVGVCRREAVDVNIGFFTRMLKKRPHITIKTAQTLTGAIAAEAGRRVDVTSRPARDHAHRLRRLFDAICVGAETVRVDDPELEAPPGRRVWHKIVITSKLQLPKRMKLLQTKGETILVCGDRTPPERVRALKRSAQVWICRTAGDGLVDLNDVALRLADYGINRVLCEGGGRLSGRFLQSDLADRCHIYLAAALYRHKTAPVSFGGWEISSWLNRRRLRLRVVNIIGNDVFLSADLSS